MPGIELPILMPALSPTMTEGKLARWVKRRATTVKAGDVLAEIETDKATMEVEAVDEGTLGKILVPEGTEGVAVNTPIALIAANGEDASRRRRAKPRRRRRQPAPGAATQPATRASRSRRRAAAPPQPPQPASPRSRPGTGKMVTTDRARGAARRDGRGDAPRPGVFLMGEEVAEYQGAYKVSQGLLRGVRRRGASSTRRSPSMASPASASARRWAGCGRSSSS